MCYHPRTHPHKDVTTQIAGAGENGQIGGRKRAQGLDWEVVAEGEIAYLGILSVRATAVQCVVAGGKCGNE